MSTVLAELGASVTRRIIGAGVPVAVGLLLIGAALLGSPPLWVRLVMLAAGGAGLAIGRAVWRATARRLILTEAGLFDDAGRPLFGLDQVAKVDRGMFAMKPSNGFAVVLKDPMPAAWAPGLWWRWGRRVGVGGSTPPRAGRAMAELLEAMLLR